MIISVDDRLNSLYEELSAMGYEVYKVSDKKDSNVIVYSGIQTHMSSLVGTANAVDYEGVFVINGDNKEASEIDSMIKNRSYSSIF